MPLPCKCVHLSGEQLGSLESKEPAQIALDSLSFSSATKPVCRWALSAVQTVSFSMVSR